MSTDAIKQQPEAQKPTDVASAFNKAIKARMEVGNADKELVSSIGSALSEQAKKASQYMADAWEGAVMMAKDWTKFVGKKVDGGVQYMADAWEGAVMMAKDWARTAGRATVEWLETVAKGAAKKGEAVAKWTVAKGEAVAKNVQKWAETVVEANRRRIEAERRAAQFIVDKTAEGGKVVIEKGARIVRTAKIGAEKIGDIYDSTDPNRTETVSKPKESVKKVGEDISQKITNLSKINTVSDLQKTQFGDILKNSTPAQQEAILAATKDWNLNVINLQKTLGTKPDGVIWNETITKLKALGKTPAISV